MRLEVPTIGGAELDALAQELRRARDASSLTQLDIAGKTDIADSTLSRYFRGEVQHPKPSVLAKLSIVLDVPYERLMALAGYPLSADPAEAVEAQALELLRGYPWALPTLRELASLPPAGRAAVFALIRTLRTGEDIEPR